MFGSLFWTFLLNKNLFVKINIFSTSENVNIQAQIFVLQVLTSHSTYSHMKSIISRISQHI